MLFDINFSLMWVEVEEVILGNFCCCMGYEFIIDVIFEVVKKWGVV